MNDQPTIVYDATMSEPGAAVATMQPEASSVCLRAMLHALGAERPQIDVARILEFDGALHAAVARALGVRPSHAAGVSCARALRAALASSSAAGLRRLLLGLSTAAQPGPAARAPTLSAAAWHACLDSALRAELYAETLGIGDPVEMRVAVLCGLAGVAGATLQPLARYRGYPVEDLIDAPFELRLGVTATVAPEQRLASADRLLGLDAERIACLEDHLPVRRAALLASAGLPEGWDDVAERKAAGDLQTLRGWLARARLWRDGVEAAAPATTGAPDASAEVAAAMASALGTRVLLLLGDLADVDLRISDGLPPREHLPSDRLPPVQHPDGTTGLRLSVAHARSRIADAVRRGEVCRVARWETTAVIDHALFDRLGAEELLVASVRTALGRRVLLSAPLPGATIEVATVALRTAVAEWADWLDRELLHAEQLRLTAASVAAEVERSVRATVHEVSSPLAIIGNYLHLLQGQSTAAREGDGPVPAAGASAARDEYLLAMHEELARAATLLHDMTTRSAAAAAGAANERAVSGGDPRQQSCAHLLRSVHMALQPLAQSRSVHFELVDPGYGGKCIEQADSVRQVLINLARNAIEAVPAHHGVVRLQVLDGRYRDGRAHLVFEVRDNGAGVPPAQRDQLAAPKQSTKGGAGLGLAIAHQLARERLRGSLDYDGGGDGSVFRLWIPEPANPADGGAGGPRGS